MGINRHKIIASKPLVNPPVGYMDDYRKADGMYTLDENGVEEKIDTGGTQTPAQIKTAYESNADTNAFTDTLKTKLDGLGASTEIKQYVARTYNPTAKQDMTLTYVEIDGSDYAFTPKSASSTIIYKYNYYLSTLASNQNLFIYNKLMVDGVEELESNNAIYPGVVGGGMQVNYTHSIPSWGLTEKTFRLYGRGHVANYGSKVHESTHLDGIIASVLVRATLEIIEIT